MRLYRIETVYTVSQKQYVVAKNYEGAEKTFLEKYPNTEIKEIVLMGNYVTIQKGLIDG